jgi:hypothetical protein
MLGGKKKKEAINYSIAKRVYGGDFEGGCSKIYANRKLKKCYEGVFQFFPSFS